MTKTSEPGGQDSYEPGGVRRCAKSLKRISLRAMKAAGAFGLVRNSTWRNRRLLILCYHGISLEDEHLWNGDSYMRPDVFEGRLDLLRRRGFVPLRLGEAVERLYAGDLPPRSVVLTFDDGTYDFLEKAWPILKAYGFPATVYLATQYAGRDMPVFDVACSYALWKAGPRVMEGCEAGWDGTLDLRTAERRSRTLSALFEHARREQLDLAAKNDLVRNLAGALGVDFERMRKRRILHILSPDEVRRLSAEGVDFELHTHTHAIPSQRPAFLDEIRQNRSRIRALTGSEPVHFCYPCGVYQPEFLPWLEEAGIRSAVTCDPGFATRASSALLLPRLVDHSHLAPVEFESWLAGVSAFLPTFR